MKEVNIFRGIAMLMILIVHSVLEFELPLFIKEIAGFGQMGCQFFFLLSAFCLCLSWEKRSDRPLLFYKKRVCSIAPGYWLTIAISVFLNQLSQLFFHHGTIYSNIKPLYVALNTMLVHGMARNGANNQVVRGSGILVL